MANGCQFCGRPATFLCDHIIGWNKNRMPHTCSAAMCDGCRTYAGMITLGGVGSIDHCPLHAGKKESFATEVMTARDAEAIRRRNRFTVVKHTQRKGE